MALFFSKNHQHCNHCQMLHEHQSNEIAICVILVIRQFGGMTDDASVSFVHQMT